MPIWPEIDQNEVLREVIELHTKHIGSPTAVATAPATWPLIGDLSEAYGGLSLCVLDSHTTAVAMTPRPDKVINVHLYRAGEQTARTSSAPRVGVDDDSLLPQGEADTTLEEVTTPAARLAGLIQQLMQRQVVSRECEGFDLSVVTAIPEDEALGFGVALDAAATLTFAYKAEDLNTAPMRAKLAEICYQAANQYSGAVASRSRYTAVLRGHAGMVNAIDYADHSVTQATNPLGRSSRTCGFAVLSPQAATWKDSEELRGRYAFIEKSTKAFGAESLHLLPEAPQRVLDWLQASHQVAQETEREVELPTVEQAGSWLKYFYQETQLAHQSLQMIRALRYSDLFNLIRQSQDAYASLMRGDFTQPLVDLCISRGARSARLAAAGVSHSVVCVVDKQHAENFAHDLAADGLTVVPLGPGQPAQLA